MTDEANHMDKYEKIKRLRTADGCTSNYPSPCSISFYKMSLLELKYLRDCLSLRTIVANSPRRKSFSLFCLQFSCLILLLSVLAFSLLPLFSSLLLVTNKQMNK
eukprot:GHVQ01021285.1.p1 GENE.GHVQ01021285.1~~GHVQ01021285.1.p1  ORF type:complete len:104 (-),score=16.33 GHVQ01021285.1:77-388(-)